MLTYTLQGDLESKIKPYYLDGVTCLRDALDVEYLRQARDCFDWSVAHPTTSACTFYESDEGKFYQDLCHPQGAEIYRQLLEDSPLADIVAKLWGSDNVWFLYEQVFLKHGTETRRTPWHQDTSYLALDGVNIATVWICFDPVEAGHSLEFVRGSHRQTLYNGSAFDPDDDTLPIYQDGLPRLPDIETDRSKWDIVSYDITPGDIVIFHPSTLHGGAATQAGTQRRTLSLRFFGDDAVYAERPNEAPAPLVTGLHETLSAGQPFRHPAFPQLRPTPAGFDAIPTAPAPSYTLKGKMSDPMS